MAAGTERILVVDIGPRLDPGIVRELQGRGVEVFSASDAVNAIVLARRVQPEAVVINDQLAGGGGMLVLKRIRSNVFTADIPVIVAPSHGSPTEREFLAAGAQECIAPPVSAEAIHGAAQRHALQSLDFTEAPPEALAQPDRLKALYDTALLDSPPEESFDRLTRLASRLLGVGVALVTLVDKDRQFFKSQVGLGQPWAGERQTRLSHSFCQWVVSGKEQLVVEDANQQPTLRKNLALKDMGVVAYAGVPLSGRGGHLIGAFCAIESRPRAWTGGDLETLRDLSQVGEAYAALKRAKLDAGEDSAGRLSNLEISTHVAGKAIAGATRILRRCGARLGEGERNDLLAIIEEQSGHLAVLVPHLP